MALSFRMGETVVTKVSPCDTCRAYAAEYLTIVECEREPKEGELPAFTGVVIRIQWEAALGVFNGVSKDDPIVYANGEAVEFLESLMPEEEGSSEPG